MKKIFTLFFALAMLLPVKIIADTSNFNNCCGISHISIEPYGSGYNIYIYESATGYQNCFWAIQEISFTAANGTEITGTTNYSTGLAYWLFSDCQISDGTYEISGSTTFTYKGNGLYDVSLTGYDGVDNYSWTGSDIYVSLSGDLKHPTQTAEDEAVSITITNPGLQQCAQRGNNTLKLSVLSNDGLSNPMDAAYINFVVDNTSYSASRIPTGSYTIKNSGTPRAQKGDKLCRYNDQTGKIRFVPESAALAKNYTSGDYDYSDLGYLYSGTVTVINPNKAEYPIYVNVNAKNSNNQNVTANLYANSYPTKRSVTVSVGTGGNGSASITSAEGYGYTNSTASDLTHGAAGTGNYYYDGTNLTLSAPAAAPGYTWSKWTKSGSSTSLSTNRTSFAVTVASGTNYNGAFVANYTPNTYTVKFAGNNNTGGSTADQAFTYGTPQNLRANGFTRAYTVSYNYHGATSNNTTESNTANYTFANWTYNSTNYSNQQNVNNLTTTNSGTVTMTAQWNSASVTLPSPAKTGHSFDGWYTAETGGTRVGGAGDSYTPTADIPLHAHWTINNHTVTITTPENGTLTVKNGETTINNNDEVEDGATLTLTATPDAGYKFGEWTNDAAASVTVDADVTLGVSFAQKSYTVAVSVAGTDANATVTRGDGGTSSTVKRYGNTILLTPNASTGYHFTGWTGTDANAAELVDNHDDTWTLTIADKSENYQYELTANFAINTYTVTWKNGETVLETDENVSYGATPSYDGDEPTKAADAQYTYAFTGWTPEVVAVTDDAVYSATFSSTPNPYTLAWVTDGDELTGTYTSGTVNYGADITAPDTPVKAGYDFAGWRSSISGNVETPASTMPAADVTYTATWTFDAFDLEDGYENGDSYYTTLSEKVGQTLNVRYKRSFTAGTWAVFSLPFGYSYRNDENRTFRGQVYTLVSAKYTSDGFLTLNCMPASTGIVANKPHILIPDVDIENPVFMNVKMKGIAPSYYTVQNTEGIGSGVEFRNTTERETLAKDKRVIYVKDNTLYYPNMTVDSWMRPFRGYFYLKIAEDEIQYYSPARVRLVNEEGETIETLPEASEETSAEVKKYIENGILVIERAGIKYDAQGHIIK